MIVQTLVYRVAITHTHTSQLVWQIRTEMSHTDCSLPVTQLDVTQPVKLLQLRVAL